MFRDKLDQFACAALDWLTSQFALAYELAVGHPRQTAKGVVAALLFVGAHYGLNLPEWAQVGLVISLTAYLGASGRDRQQRRSL